MINLNIKPLIGVGDILLLEKKTHNNLKEEHFQIEYDEEYRILSIQISKKVHEEYNVLLNGLNIFELESEELIERMSKIDTCMFDGSGYEYYFPNLNILIHNFPDDDINSDDEKSKCSSKKKKNLLRSI